MTAAEAAHAGDAFMRGRFVLVQPEDGHRAGMDALVLAAAVPSGFSGHAVDFGAGAGAAGLALAVRCPAATVTLVERSPTMAGFARRTLEHPANSGLAPRLSVEEADVAMAARPGAPDALSAGSADFVVMNPPFNQAADRSSPDALRREAHVMETETPERWLRAAAAVARRRAGVAIIARPALLGEILSALGGRFGGARICAVHPRPRADAIRIVVRARQGSRAAPAIAPPLVLHGEAGNGFSARAQAILDGEASLYGD